MQAGTGKPVWSYTFCQGAINCSPVVDGTLVYGNHGEESPGNNVQGRVVCLDAGVIKDGKPKLVWQKDGIKAKYTTPLVHDGRVYIGDDVAKLWCFDAKNRRKIFGILLRPQRHRLARLGRRQNLCLRQELQISYSRAGRQEVQASRRALFQVC